MVFNGRRYTKRGRYFQCGSRFLHREVWKHHHGEIPRGWHVHHVNGDPEDNRVENLCAMSGARHISEHHKGHGRRPDAALAALPKWRATPVGQRHMRLMGIRNAHNLRVEREFCCEQCGTVSAAKDTGANRFCSNACKAKWRRHAGLDNERRTCAACCAEFDVNRYSKQQCCSRGCSRRLWLSTDAGQEHLARLARDKRREK